MDEIWIHSQPIGNDEVKKSGSFTTLPVRINKHNDVADAWSEKLLEDWGKLIGDGQEHLSLTSPSPLGNLCSFAFPESPPERLGLVTYLCDFGLVHDDRTEAADEATAFAEHNDFESALYFDQAANAGQRASGLKQMCAQALLQCIAVDRARGLEMLDKYNSDWVAVIEKPRDHDFMSWDEYYRYRESNGGIRAFWIMVQFSIGWTPTVAENQLIKHMIWTITEGIMLTNDIWSWDREYEEYIVSGNRLINFVEVASRLYKLDTESAKEWVRNRIVACEQEYLVQKAAFYQVNPNISIELRRYVEQAGVILAGTHYWASSCARHHAWKEHRAKAQHAMDPPPAVAVPCPDVDNCIRVDSAASSTGFVHIDESIVSDHGEIGVALDLEKQYGRQVLPCWQLSDAAPLWAPIDYISSLPSQGIRSMLIEAINLWLGAPSKSVEIISKMTADLHNASLILDDIEDSSPMGRGKLATHLVFGTASSINSATFMFAESVRRCLDLTSSDCLSVLLEGLESLHRGQATELHWKHLGIIPSESEYLIMIDNKIGAFFRMLARLLLAESSCAVVDFTILVKLFGRFFQIRDNYMNLCSEQYSTRKGAFEDLDEGKISYPLLQTLQRHPAFGREIIGIFKSSRSSANGKLPDTAKEQVVDGMRACGALKATLEQICELEKQLGAEIAAIEQRLGKANTILQLIFVRLRVEPLLFE